MQLYNTTKTIPYNNYITILTLGNKVNNKGDNYKPINSKTNSRDNQEPNTSKQIILDVDTLLSYINKVSQLDILVQEVIYYKAKRH